MPGRRLYNTRWKRFPVLGEPGFGRLVAGQAVSAFGDWLSTVALIALVAELSGSATAIGGVLALRLLPSLVAGPLATSAVRRFDRRTTMLAMDALRAVAVVAIPLFHRLWWVYAIAFLVELCGLVFLPARDALVPDLVGEGDLATANGLIVVSSYANIPLGALAFTGLTLLIRALGATPYRFWAVFSIDAATFLVSFEAIRGITVRGRPPQGDNSSSGLVDFARALRLPLVRSILPALSTVALGIGTMFSLGILYVEDVLGASTAAFGALVAAFGLGAGGGLALVRRPGPLQVRTVRLGLLFMGLLLATLSFVPNLAAALAVALPFGAAAAVALVGSVTFLQQQLDAAERFLGLAAFHVVLRVGLSVAALGSGIAVSHLHPVVLALVGRVHPASLAMSLAGVVIAAGAAGVREPA